MFSKAIHHRQDSHQGGIFWRAWCGPGKSKARILPAITSCCYKRCYLFSGKPYYHFPVHSATAILQKSFVHVGWLVSMSITQGGPDSLCFAPCVYSYLRHGIDNISIAISDIPSSEVRQLLTQVHACIVKHKEIGV